MNRRDALRALLALCAPFRALAQDGKVRRIAFLHQGSRENATGQDSLNRAFLKALAERGYAEGRNVVVEWRYDENKPERLPGLAAELVSLKPEIILTPSTAATRAVQKATSTIPIVMVTVADPIGSGFVKSLARPEANITGFANMAGDVSPKLLDLLLEIVPKATRVAVLWNPDNLGSEAVVRGVQEAAQKLGRKVILVRARVPQDIAPAFAQMAKEKADALIVSADAFLMLHPIFEMATRQRLPSMASAAGQAGRGSLASYGADRAENYIRAAYYVDRLLKGARPADLPVEQPVKFDLVVNMKTAKALGITIPRSVLLRADRVIE